MELIILFVVIGGIVVYSRKRKTGNIKTGNKASPVSYKKEVRRLLQEHRADTQDCRKAMETIEGWAKMPHISKYFVNTYGSLCHFRKDETPLESYFLLIFGDMRTHHLYSRENGRWTAGYEDEYRGDRNYTLVVTTKNLYFCSDHKKQSGKKPQIISLSRLQNVVESADYVELELKSRLRGQRVHNLWVSSGNTPLYQLLNCLLEARGAADAAQ